jgi:two-component system, repressor protein LuxO
MQGQTIIFGGFDSRFAASAAVKMHAAGWQAIYCDTLDSLERTLAGKADEIAMVVLDDQLAPHDYGSKTEIIARISNDWPLLVAVSNSEFSAALEFVRAGATNVAIKPIPVDRIVLLVEQTLHSYADVPKVKSKAPEKPRSCGRVGTAQTAWHKSGYRGFIGMSPPMIALYDQIELIARSNATVMIKGESGTGKEVCAEAIHQASARADQAFIPVNCGAIPDGLMESELFGHVKGGFTGAVRDKMGAVQAANGGTLFLDEICEMPLAMQVKLLRFLQSGKIQRVGDPHPVKVDVRIICATNRCPETEAAEGRFREDLLFRLNVLPISMPALRERGTDIGILAQSFLVQFAKSEGRKLAPLTKNHLDILNRRRWPGNVRELQNLILRACILSNSAEIPANVFAENVPTTDNRRIPRFWQDHANLPSQPDQSWTRSVEGKTLDEIEQTVIEATIERCNGSMLNAAKELSISASTLYRKRERWLEKKAA